MSPVKNAIPRRSTEMFTEWLACGFLELRFAAWFMLQRVKKIPDLMHLKPRMLFVDE
jgi:hypothetical protein